MTKLQKLQNSFIGLIMIISAQECCTNLRAGWGSP